jgi:hypothetical protein
MNTEIVTTSGEFAVRYEGISYTRFAEYASYRIAVGFGFGSLAPIEGVKHVVSQLLLEIQQSLRGEFHPSVDEEFLGEALFEVDPRSGATHALILWKDHPCLARDVSRTSEDVAEAALRALTSFCEISESLQPILELMLVAEKFICDESSCKLDRYLADGNILFKATHEYLG